MALAMRSMWVQPAPLPLNDGVEIYLAEFHNADSTDAPDTRFRALVVLLSFSADTADRAALVPLLHALAFAKCSSAVCSSEEWPDRLAERISHAPPDCVVAAIYCGSTPVVAAATVQSAVQAMRRVFGSSLGTLLLVSDADRRWSSLEGVSGFVCGGESTHGETARQVFLILSSFGAPKTLNGIDLVDLLPVLGTADAPSVACEALWLRDCGGRIVHLSEFGKRTVASADCVQSFPIQV